jgi:putative transposase
MNGMCLTYRYRLLPTRQQHQALARILEGQRQLYNAALAERIDCYSKTGNGRTYVDQCAALTQWRRDDIDAKACPLNIHRWTIRRVDDAYKAFFRRVKQRSAKAGFPRFRGKGWWNSFGFNEFVGANFDGKRIRFASMPGALRVHMHREMPEGRLLSCTFTRDGRGWFVAFQMRIAAAEVRAPTASVGIDVGLTTLAALSDGTAIPNPRHAKRAEREMRRRQRALARCKQGSNGRRKVRAEVTRWHRKITATRDTHLHQISADLVKRFDLIAVEKLNVKGLAGSMLAKSVHDASWGKLRQLLTYKAERAGAQLIEVNPRHTSQTCPECGCGCCLDRDHAAALVILGKAVAGLGAHNVAGCGERAPGNLIPICDETLPIRSQPFLEGEP